MSYTDSIYYIVLRSLNVNLKRDNQQLLVESRLYYFSL